MEILVYILFVIFAIAMLLSFGCIMFAEDESARVALSPQETINLIMALNKALEVGYEDR